MAKSILILLGALLVLYSDCSEALAAPRSRRRVLQNVVSAGAGVVLVAGGSSIANAADVDIDSFLSTGGVAMPMGVSGQAGKSKPVTGVELKDGTEVSRDKKGNVFAEILLSDNSGKKFPTAISFISPWKLETGAVFDIETRDAASGDSAFLAVSPDVQGKSISELKDSFFVDALFGPYGRFSFYGQPTDVKYKKGVVNDNGYRTIDVSFSILNQSTQSELPRKARIMATIPTGSSQAVMLVGSASLSRWNKGSEKAVGQVLESFRAAPAPTRS